jgi:DnaJ-class molecular chaperone
MKLVSRYDVHDVVYGIYLHTKRYWKLCNTCEGTCKVTVAGHEDVTTYCPSCRGGKIWQDTEGKYFVIQQLTVGQVRIQAGYEPETRYMCEETGVGSGTVWREENLFLTMIEAELDARSRGAVAESELQIP